jgi:hypothetical protein
MQPEWNKLNLSPVISEVTQDLEARLGFLKSQLEEETKKLQNITEIFAVELQKILDNHLDK